MTSPTNLTRTVFGRALRTGLSWLRHRASNLRCRLAALRFNPSRKTIPQEPDALALDVMRRSEERVKAHARALGFKVPD
jgi:hypothetical protein